MLQNGSLYRELPKSLNIKKLPVRVNGRWLDHEKGDQAQAPYLEIQLSKKRGGHDYLELTCDIIQAQTTSKAPLHCYT